MKVLSAVLLFFALLIPVAAQEEPSPPPPADDSPFQRRDAPPGGVLAQLNYGGGVRGGEGQGCDIGPYRCARHGACLCDRGRRAAGPGVRLGSRTERLSRSRSRDRMASVCHRRSRRRHAGEG